MFTTQTKPHHLRAVHVSKRHHHSFSAQTSRSSRTYCKLHIFKRTISQRAREARFFGVDNQNVKIWLDFTRMHLFLFETTRFFAKFINHASCALILTTRNVCSSVTRTHRCFLQKRNVCSGVAGINPVHAKRVATKRDYNAAPRVARCLQVV